jgi:antitoxin (DNA-binding transcriptional repressor) of toxin-antitoxin stability system
MTHYATLSDARSHLPQLTDAAISGRPVSFARDGRQVAAVDADRLHDALAKLHPARTEVFQEDGAVGIAISDLGLAVEGTTFAAAVNEMVVALREYAADWTDHLLNAPNHANNWGVVQIIALSTDEELASWVRGA